ncbi:DUF1120 domain-containing protein [Enterobacter cloacae]|uniref:DUF1120 domain-containing protein n=1 Tax=Enterobacter TaxID=547 RepID=UPI000683027A|nr:DUF1120 domain-containing protein [Enterobacter cloacae]ELE9015426.1 DUF1120 domain-containing protein [Enterobacter cloacae]ELK7442855.1 DUF1120 domain-containing protein [Enterobacter cloacae]KZP71437.1 hypothetical protein A3N40_06410 [Enterobacter cloacae subsp. dissolvens]MBA7849335.1 DUF1120 domain-containing protein [Enterobacter cloacae]MBW4201133.1 DUF1120 domain-containing protein [Enterobacter cloacae subsp. cloacae]
MNALIKKGMLATVLAMSVNTAMAAQSIDIKVTGKILPSSCTPSFPSGGGIADFGTMKVASLNSTSMTPLADLKEIPVTINCEEATRVAVKFTDARDDSSPTESVKMGNGFSGSPFNMFGLGMYNDKKIGAYTLALFRNQGANTNGNGDSLYPLLSIDGGETWLVKGTDYMQINSDNSEIYAFTLDTANGVPSPESKINFKVAVSATINPTNDLNVTDELTLDGLTNIELVYL